MGHGTPDWWGSEPTSTIFQTQDAGELAARLGSIDSFDRRGNVVFLEDFSNGLSYWTVGGVGTGYRVVLSTIKARSGPYSAKLVTGSTSPFQASASKELPYQVKGWMGIEAHLALHYYITKAEVWHWLYDGVNESDFAIQLDPVNNCLNYLNSAFGWTKLADITIDTLADPPFLPIKMVVDTEADKYLWCLFNGVEYDMSGIAAWTSALPTMPRSSIMVDAYGTSGQNAYLYLDDIIITQNER